MYGAVREGMFFLKYSDNNITSNNELELPIHSEATLTLYTIC